jgi:hypothetical protein
VLPPLSLARAAHLPIRCVTIAAQFVKFRPTQQPIDWRLVLTDTALDLCVPASSALAAFLPAAVRLISAASLTMDGLYTYHGSYSAQCQVRTTNEFFFHGWFLRDFARFLSCLFVCGALRLGRLEHGLT